jgi:hypothetical protein
VHLDGSPVLGLGPGHVRADQYLVPVTFDLDVNANTVRRSIRPAESRVGYRFPVSRSWTCRSHSEYDKSSPGG